MSLAPHRRQLRIGPQHNGRRMSFARFQRAASVPGYLYELASGVIEVTDVPGKIHALILRALEKQLTTYDVSNPGVIEHMAGAAAAKTELPELESERHPDLSIYLTPWPDDSYPWDQWVPTIAIEIVSPGAAARRRDYETKRREYLVAGILEYWIFDPQQERMLALTRHGDTWREHKLTRKAIWTSSLLPGFSLRLERIFAVLDKPGAE